MVFFLGSDPSFHLPQPPPAVPLGGLHGGWDAGPGEVEPAQVIQIINRLPVSEGRAPEMGVSSLQSVLLSVPKTSFASSLSNESC